MFLPFLIVVLADSAFTFNNSCITDFLIFLRKYNLEEERHCNNIEQKAWDYYVDTSHGNEGAKLKARNDVDSFKKWVWNETRAFNATCLADDQALQRQFVAIVRDVGSSVLSNDKIRQLQAITAEMEENIAKGFKGVERKDLSLDELFKKWVEWKRTVGKSNYFLYQKSVELWSEACKLHGFSDCTKYWLSYYEDPEFFSKLETVWEQVKPLYLQLHTYVRKKLIQIHGTEKITPGGPIPAQFLGGKFASNWRGIYNRTLPFTLKKLRDITDDLIKKKITAAGIFKLCENFYTSLGLSKMPVGFWKKSLLEKPINKTAMCIPSAWDFCNRKDFRIHQCTKINQKNFITAHHEMGHIQYYINYAHLPIAFRAGANPAFHEAIGDTIALSVMSNNYFEKISSIDNKQTVDNETSLNFLYMMSLEKVPVLPFSILVDMWRRNLFSKKVDHEVMTKNWWDMRLRFQGVSSPIEVKEEDGFELGCIIQVIKNIDYIRYFASVIFQFQFYEGLCNATGHVGPLHTCNIYGSKKAGQRLKEALHLGASKPWPEVMRILTNGNTSTIDARALLNYFQPLYDWLKEYNQQSHARLFRSRN